MTKVTAPNRLGELMAEWPTHKARALKRKQRVKWLNSKAGKAWQQREADLLTAQKAKRKGLKR